MKKIAIIGIAIGSVVAASAVSAGIAVPIVLKETNRTFDYGKFLENKNFDTLDFKMDTVTEQSDDIIQYANAADINLFYNSTGIIAYTYMMQIALLTAPTSEVHFAYSPNGKNLEHQSATNEEALETVFKGFNSKSEVINMGKDVYGNVIDQWVNIIKQNPDKKINIWWNSFHVDHRNGSISNKILEVAGFDNVNINLLEDGSGMTYKIPTIQDAQLQQKYSTIESFTDADENSQFLAPLVFENVYSWFSNSAFNTQLIQQDPEKYKNYNVFSAGGLTDALFNTRTKDYPDISAVTTPNSPLLPFDNARMSSIWPIVSGLDWHTGLELLKQSQIDRPGKKSMIILGSFGDPAEQDFIKHIWETYHEDYNIFYKGHPGHADYVSWINDEFIPNEATEGMYVLEAQINSEQFTRDHVNEGMFFDAVVSVTDGTSALNGFPISHYNLHEDLLELLVNGQIIVNGDENWIANGYDNRIDTIWQKPIQP